MSDHNIDKDLTELGRLLTHFNSLRKTLSDRHRAEIAKFGPQPELLDRQAVELNNLRIELDREKVALKAAQDNRYAQQQDFKQDTKKVMKLAGEAMAHGEELDRQRDIAQAEKKKALEQKINEEVEAEMKQRQSLAQKLKIKLKI